MLVFGFVSCRSPKFIRLQNARFVSLKNNPIAFRVDNYDRIKSSEPFVMPFKAQDTLPMFGLLYGNTSIENIYYFEYDNTLYASGQPEIISLRDLRKLSLIGKPYPISKEKIIWSRILD